MNDELKQLLSKPVANVPDVGRVCFGLTKNASYEAAKRGDFACIRMGGRIVVPTAPLRKMLGIEEKAIA